MIPAIFLDGRVSLHQGDCLDVLRLMPEASVDAVVTDPPYHLTSIVNRFGGENAAPAKAKQTGAFARASKGFMGQTWDGGDIAFRPELWSEVLRVLKPGGHIAAFSSTRTYHRMACAIEDAGFEIRDQLAWTYGTGFPKSHDVTKGIEKRRDEDIAPVRVVCRFLRAAMDSKGLKSRDLVDRFGGCNPRLIDHWAARDTDSQPSLPTPDQWQALKVALDLDETMDAEVARLNDRKGEFGGDWHAREITGSVEEWSDRSNYALTSRDGLRRDVASTSLAREWQGWGTALKPAWEPIALARKALIGTVAQNVLTHGVGSLNIDGCRIPFAGNKLDRWPANILHDGNAGFGEQGRFFYTAKADADDRIGSKHPTVKPVDLMQWLVRLVVPKGGKVLDLFAGTGTTGEAAWREGMNAVLIEREPVYAEDIARRMQLAGAGPAERLHTRMKVAAAPLDHGPLFGMPEVTL